VSILNAFPYISLCKMKCLLVGPFLGRFYFYVQTLKTMCQGCCISNIRIFGLPLHEKKIFKNSPNFTPFRPLLGPNRCQPLNFCKLKSPFAKDDSYQIWFKSVQWFLKVSVLNAIPYISLCKMKHPLVGPFLCSFYFYVNSLQTMSQGCCMSNIRVFGLPVYEKKIF